MGHLVQLDSFPAERRVWILLLFPQDNLLDANRCQDNSYWFNGTSFGNPGLVAPSSYVFCPHGICVFVRFLRFYDSVFWRQSIRRSRETNNNQFACNNLFHNRDGFLLLLLLPMEGRETQPGTLLPLGVGRYGFSLLLVLGFCSSLLWLEREVQGHGTD